MNKEEQLNKEFNEEIKKPYYTVSYLDNFKLPYEKLDVSIIIPTYNRCPYRPDTLKENNNPLTWVLDTALNQKIPVKEIIVVDDASTDYTKEIVKKYSEYSKKEQKTPVIYIQSKDKVGASKVRNLGASKANGKYLLFTDDDMFISPYSAFGAVFSFEWIKNNGINIGIINLPFYSRSSFPNKIVKKNEIANVSFLRGSYTSNKNAFPIEYLSSTKPEEKFIHFEYHILKPIPIENSGGYILCEKDTFLKVGGFPENIIKRGEDRELGFRFIENGYPVYLSVDPKFQGVHGSYGLKLGKSFTGVDWFKSISKNISIKKAMEICDDPKTDTGARIDPKDYIYDAILSFFILSYIRNKKGAIKWIKRVNQSFVKEGSYELFSGSPIPIPQENERKAILFGAVNKGLKFLINLEKKEIKKMKETINQLKHEEKITEDIFSILESY